MSLFTCTECQRILGIEEFKIKDPATGRRSRKCKECHKRTDRLYQRNKRTQGGNWLFFGCIHLPFEHPDALAWLKHLHDKYGFTKIVMLGDWYDWGGLNRFMKNPNMPSPLQEYQRTIEVRQQWYEAFPEVECITGNHDLRPLLRAGEAYLPDIILKDIREVMGFPAGWKQHGSQLLLNHSLLGEVLCIHGDKVNKNALTNAKACGKNIVMADRHTMCNVGWCETMMGERRFGINTGAMIDAEREAFAYCRGRMMKPLIAVGAIIDGNPVNLVMPVDAQNRWRDR